MPASIVDNKEKVVFQCDINGNNRRIRKTNYLVFESQQDNHVFQVDVLIRVKAGFAKNQYDLIKTDHMILQKRGLQYFLLFEADKNEFRESDGQTSVFEENLVTSNYDYRIMIRHNKNAQSEAEKEQPVTGSDEAINRINNMLYEHGITDADVASPVNEFMKSWKLGHPDEN